MFVGFGGGVVICLLFYLSLVVLVLLAVCCFWGFGFGVWLVCWLWGMVVDLVCWSFEILDLVFVLLSVSVCWGGFFWNCFFWFCLRWLFWGFDLLFGLFWLFRWVYGRLSCGVCVVWLFGVGLLFVFIGLAECITEFWFVCLWCVLCFLWVGVFGYLGLICSCSAEFVSLGVWILLFKLVIWSLS